MGGQPKNRLANWYVNYSNFVNFPWARVVLFVSVYYLALPLRPLQSVSVLESASDNQLLLAAGYSPSHFFFCYGFYLFVCFTDD